MALKSLSARRPLALLTASLLLTQHAFAQPSGAAYPSEPIRVVVNFAAGGGVDTLARVVAEGLQKQLKATVVVENRPGAGGEIGAEYVARSSPNGYTLLVTNGGALHTNPHLMKLKFDPLKSLTPITDIARVPNLLIVRKDLPAHNVAEFVAYLRAHPGKVTFASQGLGSTAHISGEMLNVALDTHAVHVPYRGSSLIYPDLLRGRVDFMFDGGAALPYVKSDSLRLLATTSAERLSLFPDTPTMIEGGVPDFVIDSYHSMQAPAGTPKNIIMALNDALVTYLRSPEVQQKISNLGLEVAAHTPDAAAAEARHESDRIGALVRKLGIGPK